MKNILSTPLTWLPAAERSGLDGSPIRRLDTLIDVRIPFGLELFPFYIRIIRIRSLFRIASHPLKNEPLHAALAGLALVAVLGHAEGSAAAAMTAEGVARGLLVRVASAVVALVRAPTPSALHVRALC